MKKNSKPLSMEEINEKMLYPEKSRNWARAKQYGDITCIATELKMSNVYISRALNTGVGSLKVLRYIDEYYKERERHLRSG